MAILDGVEVRVVLKDNQEVLEEYNKPDSNVADKPHFVEKYIEAKTGQNFEVQVFIKEDFKCGPGWGIAVGIKIDGGVVFYHRSWDYARVEQMKKLMKPEIFESVRHTEGSLHSRIGFRFGSLTIDENIDVARDVLDGQAADLGTIRIWINKVDRKRLPRARPSGSTFYNPLKTTDVAKELIKTKHVGSVLQLVYPSDSATVVTEVPVQRLAWTKGNAKGTQTESIETPMDSTIMASRNPVSSSGNDDMDRKFARLEQQLSKSQQQLKESQEQLKQSQERTATMIQNCMGGFSSMMQAFAASTSSAPAASPTVQLPVVKSEPAFKREYVKEEEDTENGGLSGGLGRRPVKRIKTIIELD
ncbi:MAG: hypothetical protein Q9171_007076 [Xanthocarpia ochracea]